MKKIFIPLASILLFSECTSVNLGNKIQPVLVTEKVVHDTDDPAIWIHPTDREKSLIIGTDKDKNGALFVFDLQGKIIQKIPNLKRPNNVDVEYGFHFEERKIDIAVVTERNENKIRIYELPSMKEIGAISVFDGEKHQKPMGIALYKNKETQEIYAIISRKYGEKLNYLWQYLLTEKGGKIEGKLVRKFGHFSGEKEIESIAVDDELGYVYYSDELFGIHKYHAQPEKGNKKLAVFGQKDFREDIEGISIYKTDENNGYILVSNQQKNTFNIYTREGEKDNPHLHLKIAEIPLSTQESDGSEVVNIPLNPKFPKGLFVAMSNGRVFHYYDWQDLQARINEQLKKRKK